jgi:hypothetical protein
MLRPKSIEDIHNTDMTFTNLFPALIPAVIENSERV